MRIVTAYAYDTSIANLQKRQQDLSETQIQLTSGKRVNRASDDPTAAARAERALASIARSDANKRALDASANVMGIAESALGDAVELLQHALDVWYHDMDEAWSEWLAARERYRALVARLIGAKRPDCIVPKASAGQGLRAVLNALEAEKGRKLRVVASDGEFDSIDLILRVYREKGRIDLRLMPWEEMAEVRADLLVLNANPLTDIRNTRQIHSVWIAGRQLARAD